MKLIARSAFAAACAAALLTLVPVAPVTAAEVAGVNIADTVRVGGRELRLNGAGVRTRAVFKVYVMGLYLPKKETTPAAVLATAGPRRFTIVMLRDVPGEDFGQAFMTGINNNTDKAEKGRIVNQMVKFGEMFVNVGGLKKADTLNVDWVPDRGTLIELNGKPIIEPQPDVTFYNALLKIWLGDKPADGPLKTELLGG